MENCCLVNMEQKEHPSTSEGKTSKELLSVTGDGSKYN